MCRYIEPFKGELNEESAFSHQDQFHSPSLQTMANSSMIKSDATYPPRKTPRRMKISDERLNQLAQPRGQRHRPPPIDELRSNPIRVNHVDQMFDSLGDISYQKSFASKEQTSSTDDRRFQKLIHLFSDVYGPAPSKFFDSPRQQERKSNPVLPPIERKDQQDIRNDSHLIDACA